MDQLPRLGKRPLICLLLCNCNYVVSVRRGFLFLWVLGMGCVILLIHFLNLPKIFYKSMKILPDAQELADFRAHSKLYICPRYLQE